MAIAFNVLPRLRHYGHVRMEAKHKALAALSNSESEDGYVTNSRQLAACQNAFSQVIQIMVNVPRGGF